MQYETGSFRAQTSSATASRSINRFSHSWDVPLLAVVTALLGFGLVMLYSSSAIMAAQKLGDPMYLVKTQGTRIGLGFLLMIGALHFDYRWYKRLVYPILAGAFGLLIAVLVPGLGMVQNGAQRWFSVAGLSFQPAEVVKIAAIMYLAYSVTKKGENMKKFSIGFVPHLLVVGGLVALLMRQPDFGSSVLILTMMAIMMFCAGARLIYFILMAPIAGLAVYIAVTGSEYRMRRIMAFLDPWSYQSDAGYQISESLISIGSGQITGVGLGAGRGKLGYVPELWNDFIGTIIAEELGLLGIIALVLLVGAFLWRGYAIAFRAVDRYGLFLAFGLTTLIGIQSVANLCVVTGLLPNKGLTLPFVSFGGSSVMMCLFAVGILLNISKQNPDVWEDNRDRRAREKDEKRWEKKRRSILKRRGDLARRWAS